MGIIDRKPLSMGAHIDRVTDGHLLMVAVNDDRPIYLFSLTSDLASMVDAD